MDVFNRLAKTILSCALLFIGRFLKPRKLPWRDERLEVLDAIFQYVINKEIDPLMKARWSALRNVTLWLVTHDGAYRLRAIVLCKLISEYENYWYFRCHEPKFGL